MPGWTRLDETTSGRQGHGANANDHAEATERWTCDLTVRAQRALGPSVGPAPEAYGSACWWDAVTMLSPPAAGTAYQASVSMLMRSFPVRHSRTIRRPASGS